MSDNNTAIEDLEFFLNKVKLDYDPWNMLTSGEEVFHISNNGEVRQVDIFSEEGQEVLRKIDNDR